MASQTPRKGISPLIASVLLLAFTMSVAMMAGPFFSNTLKSAQENTDQKAKSVVKASNMNIDIVSSKYNGYSGNMSILVQNKGSKSIKSGLSINIFGEVVKGRSFKAKIGQGELKSFDIPVDLGKEISRVSVSLEDYPVSDELENPAKNFEVIDGFEDGNTDEYNVYLVQTYAGGVGYASAVENPKYSGSYSGKFHTDDNSDTAMLSTNGLGNYPERGEIFRVSLNPNDGMNLRVFFGLQSNSTRNNTYRVRLDTDGYGNENIYLDKFEDGSSSSISSSSLDFNSGWSGWNILEVSWLKNGTIEAELLKPNGEIIGKTSGTDTTFDKGGIGIDVGTSANTGRNAYVDKWIKTDADLD